MKAILVTALMALCIPAVCGAVDLPQTIQTKDGFTISLPADWVPIPKDALDRLTQKAAKQAPKAERQTFDYAFQLPMKKHWLEHPYIVVQIKRIGRVPDGELKSFTRLREGVKEGVDKAQNSYSATISNAQVGETIYEPATHILWTHISLDVKPVGPVKGVVASLLTEDGMIVICGYATAAEYDQYAPVFEAVARNTVVADNLKYRPRFTDSFPLGGQTDRKLVIWGTLIGVVFTGLAVTTAVALEARRKKKAASGQANGSRLSC